MNVYETRSVFVIAAEVNGTFRVPVRKESFRFRISRDLDSINLTGAYVYKSKSAANRALRALEN